MIWLRAEIAISQRGRRQAELERDTEQGARRASERALSQAQQQAEQAMQTAEALQKAKEDHAAEERAEQVTREAAAAQLRRLTEGMAARRSLGLWKRLRLAGAANSAGFCCSNATGLLEKIDDRHVNAADVERFLVQGKPGYMGPWITFTKPQWNEWGRLSEHLRETNLRVMGTIGDFTVEDARRYHNATYSIGLGAGRRFVRQVDLTGRQRIMDIGGGSGAYCIAAANEHATLTAVVLDLSPVCEVAREFIAEHGLSDRIEAQPCDFTRDQFPSDCDVAIMASNLPMYSREMIAMVVRKAHDALLPGGEMHLIGETTRDNRTAPWGPAYWGLGQAINDSLGLAHSEADVTGYFRAAGFEAVTVYEFIPGSLSRIVGRKPV